MRLHDILSRSLRQYWTNVSNGKIRHELCDTGGVCRPHQLYGVAVIQTPIQRRSQLTLCAPLSRRPSYFCPVAVPLIIGIAGACSAIVADGSSNASSKHPRSCGAPHPVVLCGESSCSARERAVLTCVRLRVTPPALRAPAQRCGRGPYR
jgi:hypothetical protein